MSFEQIIVSFIIAMPLVFTAGILVGSRDQREPAPSAIPSNMDVASVLTAEKAARAEAAVLQGVALKALERCNPSSRETH